MLYSGCLNPTSHFPPYSPSRWLRNGHVNTVYSFLRRRVFELPPAQAHWVNVAEGVQVLLKLHWQSRHAPVLILVHGLEGSSEAGYMMTTAAKAWRRGWHVVRMNVRNCGESEERCDVLYNSGLSGDVMRVLDWALAQSRVETALLCGFSMGGNLVLKYAGEAGSAHPSELAAVVAISPCMDLSPSATALHRKANWLYEQRFLLNLKARIRRKAQRRPELGLPLERLPEIRSVREFDDIITAPFTGYRDAEDYYRKASASRVIDDIRVPTLILHAEDDPFIVVTPESRRKMAANPAVHFIATPHGGHCAFMNRRQPDEDLYWAENRAVEFCAWALQRRCAGKECCSPA